MHQLRSCPWESWNLHFDLKNKDKKGGLQQPQQQLLRTSGSISKSSALFKLVRLLKGVIPIPNILKKEILTRSSLSEGRLRSILSTESSNLLMRNRNYQNLKSKLSIAPLSLRRTKGGLSGEGSSFGGLKKRIQAISCSRTALEDKPTKNYILFQYLKSLNKYKVFRIRRKNESILNYNKIIGYKFNSTYYPGAAVVLRRNQQLPEACSRAIKQSRKENSLSGGLAENQVNSSNIYIKDTYKLLFYLFKSMYCLISKPVLKYTNDKVIIQLFYYLNIPKKKVFRLFYKSLRVAEQSKEKSKLLVVITRTAKSPSNSKIHIRWKLRKAISRFKNKNNKKLLFNLRKFNLTAKAVFQHKFKLICDILSKKFNKPVELQLTRLHQPYHDSNILVNLLSLNFKNKKKRARVAINKIYSKKNLLNVKLVSDNNCEAFANSTPNYSKGSSNNPNFGDITGLEPLIPEGETLLSKKETKNFNNLNSVKFIPAFLSGLNIKIAGRLMGEPIIPRITTKVFERGATSTGKVNYLDVARITKKNRKGAYTIKITSGQNFF